MTTTPPTSWILSDGTAGMENQARGLADAMGLDYRLRALRPSPLLRLLPAWGRVPGVPAGGPGGDRLGPPFPDVLITCGRRHAGASIAVKRMSGGRVFTVHIQDPRTAPGLFDLLVVPQHDRVRGPNVITTTGSLHRVTEAGLARAAARLAAGVADLPRPRVAVNIGGGTRQRAVGRDEAERVARTLAGLPDRHGCSLLVTTSRRTDPVLREALGRLGDRPDTLVWRGDGPNPYLGFLGLADVVVVTSDSINMVSEACATGKPVYLLPLGETSRRRAAFLDAVRARGLAHMFDGGLDAAGQAPLRDTEQAARQVLDRLVERGIAARPRR